MRDPLLKLDLLEFPPRRVRSVLLELPAICCWSLPSYSFPRRRQAGLLPRRRQAAPFPVATGTPSSPSPAATGFFGGVEAVMADAGIGKLTVVGKLDPWKLRDHVEAKSHKKVDLISPTNFPKNADKARKPSVAKQSDEKKNQEKHDGDAENSIALRRMHPSNPQDHPQDQRTNGLKTLSGTKIDIAGETGYRAAAMGSMS